MQVSTQSSVGSLFTPLKEQFLIVPIFFKKQIEAIIAAKAPDYAFGFFYGEQRENYRIIKKIWPVTKVDNADRQIGISAEDFEIAKSMQRGNLKLLGCFYTSGNGRVNKALLSSSQMDSFSFVKLEESANQTCTWSSSIGRTDSDRFVNQKVIL